MHKIFRRKFNRCLALLIVLCFMLSSINSGMLISYAYTPEEEYQIGDDVVAALSENGVLSIRGTGDTYNYKNEEGSRAPFYDRRELITGIEIGEGVTSIGDYMLYNCANLTGELIFPESMAGIGEGAFSGDSAQQAPSFTYVSEQFEGADIAVKPEGESEEPEASVEPPADNYEEPEAVLPEPSAQDNGGRMIPQTISKTVGSEVVEISGNLPEGAEVCAETVELTEELLGLVSQAVGGETSEIFFALDITILVDGVKYQPSEYGESVTVNIRNLENLPAEDLSIVHLTQNEESRELDLVETISPQSIEGSSVEFQAESFSLYVAAKAGTQAAARQGTITFDLAKGPVTLGENYSGTDTDGNEVSGTHNKDNYYIVTQSNANELTANTIKFGGNEQTFHVELDGINVKKVFNTTANNGEGDFENNSSIYIPAYKDNVKHVTLYLHGKNTVDNICYYTIDNDVIVDGTGASASTLTITSAAGDGRLDGSLTIDASSHERYTCIGGTGNKSTTTGLTIAGGTIRATNKGYDAAIGGGSNGYADITISGGYITATQEGGTAPAIGSGSGGTTNGGNAKINITGGEVIAKSSTTDFGGVAIGAGSVDGTSTTPPPTPGTADITISGGTVTASVSKDTSYGFSSGYDKKENEYAEAKIQITGGSVNGTMQVSSATDGGSTQVKLTTVTLKSGEEPQKNLAVDALTLTPDGTTYGTKDMKTDDAGKLYLWLAGGVSVTAAQVGLYPYTGSVASGEIGDLTNGAIIFDLAKDNVVLGQNGKYSGKDSAENEVTGVHKEDNYYIVMQSNAENATQNTIKFSGNQQTFQVVLDGIHVKRQFEGASALKQDDNREQNSSIYIPADRNNVKHVTLYLSGNNIVDNICYYTYGDDNNGTAGKQSNSTLKITSAKGDGSTEGKLTIDASGHSRYTCIGGTGTMSTTTGLTIAGGTICATNSEFEAAIGSGSNGYADITITGGHITATQTAGNAPAIGSGSGSSAVGADAKITIEGGYISAVNKDSGGTGVAIGAGGSKETVGGAATVDITGGQIDAKANGGTAIGGGNSTKAKGGSANVTVLGGTVASNGAIGGGFSATYGYADDTTITVTGGSLNARMSETPTNGTAGNVYLTSATLYSADKRVIDTAVDTIGIDGYGMKDVRTDGNGTLYLWLPEDKVLKQAKVGEDEFTGSILAKYTGILTHNSAKTYYSVHFPYDDRFTVRNESGGEITGTLTVPAGEVLSFKVEPKVYSGTDKYSIKAYRSLGTKMEFMEGQATGNGLSYGLTVTSNTELLFVTQAGEHSTPRLSLDISAANAVIGDGSVTIGGYTLSGYNGDLLLTSGALPTANKLTVQEGTHNILIDHLIAQRSGNVIEVDGGTVNADVSNFNNSITSTGESAILVKKDAAFNLKLDHTADSLTVSSHEDTNPPIGGSGKVHIEKTGGFLSLAGGPENVKVTAESYSYTTNALKNENLPYPVKLTSGELAGYHDGTKLLAPDAKHTVTADTTFTACGVSYVLQEDITQPKHSITNVGKLSIPIAGGVKVQSVKRDGEDLQKESDYKEEGFALVISSAYGLLEITLIKEGDKKIVYKAADYSAEYTGKEHTFTVTAVYPEGAKVEYSIDNSEYSSTAPTMTDVGSKTVKWKITADGFNDASGENEFTVTKGTNQWLTELTCPSIQFGAELQPSATAKWGEVTYSYYAANDLETPLGQEPTEAGSYYARAKVEKTGNYDELTSEFVPFTIENTIIYSASGKFLQRLSTQQGVPISKEVTAPANGAFTVSYGFHYIPDSEKTPLTMEFSKTLPAGTKLTVLDICQSHEDKPRFFYYIVPEGGITSIASTAFYKMGTNQTGTYENETANTAREVQYQLCVEFPKNAADASEFTIQLKKADAEITDTAVHVTRTAPEGTARLSLNESAGGERQITTNAIVPDGVQDSVLAVSLLDGNGKSITLPAGASILLGGDGKEPDVQRGGFAVFNNISAGSHKITVTGLPAGSYKLKTDLCRAGADKAYPLAESMSSETTDSLSVTAPAYAVKAELADGQSRVVDGTSGAVLTFNVSCSPATGAELGVSIQKKENGEYQDLDSDASWTSTKTASAVTVTVPENTASGTYRIVFRWGDAEFLYNIIVKQRI